MSELYFGYASFVYFVDKRGYTIQSQAENRITFWLAEKESRDEYDPYQLRYSSETDCGCVVINPQVLEERFKDDKTGLIQDLTAGSKRMKQIVHNKLSKRDEIKIPHCHEPGHETPIYGGEIVRCKK